MKQLVFSLALLVTVSASAQEGQWFAQGGVGQLKTSLATTGEDIKTDASSTSKSISIGYGLSQNLAVVAGYRDFGTLRVYRNTGSSQFSASMKGSAYTLGAVYSWGVTDAVTVEAAGGAYRWTNEIDAPQGAGNATVHGTKAYFGAGVSYALTQQTSIGLQWTRFKSADSDIANPDVFEAVVRYRF